MAYRLFVAVTLTTLLLFGSAQAQPPWSTPVPPPAPMTPGAIPLLYVKLTGPAGSRVTVYDGISARTFASPLTIGLRPGVPCRFSIEGLPDTDEAVHGSILARDVLRLPPNQRAADFPAPMSVSTVDLDQIRTGTMLAKWLVLEDPNRPPSTQLTPGQPAEVPNVIGDDPEESADLLGRTLAVAYLGGREPAAEELAAIPGGLVIFPELADRVPSINDPRILPIIQPPKGGEEVLKDGGDAQEPARLDRTGKLQGVESTDTVAEYTSHSGLRRLAISNRVCVVAPRFVLLRHEVPLNISASVLEPTPMSVVQAREQLDRRQKSQLKRQTDEADLLRRRDRLQAAVQRQAVRRIHEVQPLAATEMVWEPHIAFTVDELGKLTKLQKAKFTRQLELAGELTRVEGLGLAKVVVGTEVLGQVEELGQVRAVYEPRDVTFVCEPDPQLPDQPLFIQKWASAESAKAGDILTFSILYKNVGGKPIRQIAVVDSLSSRLEYVAGSAQSDREAVFITQDNEVGSLLMRWEVKEPLPPGKHGVVKFQARVK